LSQLWLCLSLSGTYTVPATLPPFFSHQALDYYVGEYTRTGIQPAKNWCAAIDKGWENTSFLDCARGGFPFSIAVAFITKY
jgi:hypothetical protein